MVVIPNPKMAFIFPISCILVIIFPIFIIYFPKCEGKGSFPKSQIKSLNALDFAILDALVFGCVANFGLKKTKNWFLRPIIAYCRSKVLQNAPRGALCNKVLQILEHSAILLTFIKLPFVIKIFVLSIFEWSFCTGFTVVCLLHLLH